MAYKVLNDSVITDVKDGFLENLTIDGVNVLTSDGNGNITLENVIVSVDVDLSNVSTDDIAEGSNPNRAYWTDGRALTLLNTARVDANTYTDSVAGNIYSSFASADQAILSQSNSYTDTQVSQANLANQSYTDTQVAVTLSQAQTYAQGVANVAESNAISTATSISAADATTKANQAEANAIASANSNTATEINDLQDTLENYTDAAEVNAIAVASADATMKANAAQANAIAASNSYTDSAVSTGIGSSTTDDISEGTSNLYFTSARVDTIVDPQFIAADTASTNKANTAESNAIAAAALDATVKADQAEADALSAAQVYTDFRNTTLIGDPTIDGTIGNTISSRLTSVSNNAQSYTDSQVTKTVIDGLNIEAASVQADSVALGTDTTGNYVATISGTTGEIDVTGSAGEGTTPVISLPNNMVVPQDLTITGDLTVQGTTIINDTTTVAVDDPYVTVGGTTVPTSDDNKDRGVRFRWHDGTNAKVGFFGWDDSKQEFTIIPDATETGEVFSGTVGDAKFGEVKATSFVGPLVGDVDGDVVGNLTGNVTGNVNGTASLATLADQATVLKNTRDIILNGDVSGSASFNGSSNATITVAVTDDSHNHTTSTITNFVENVQDIVGGMVNPTNVESGLNVFYDDVNGKLNFNVDDPVITLTGDVSGSATMVNLGNVSINVTVDDDSHNHTIANVDGLQSALDSKQASGNYITTTTAFGGDVSGTYDAIVISDDSHNHTIANIDGLQDALDNITGAAGNYLTETSTFGGDVSGTYDAIVVADNSHNHTTSTITGFTDDVIDIVGGMVTDNSENGISVIRVGNKLNFNVADPTITLTGDVSGAATMMNLGNVSIDVEVANDSHSHTIANVTGLQTALDDKADSSHTHTISEVTGLQTALDDKVDNSRVLTDVPAGALFTDTNTTYSKATNTTLGLTRIGYPENGQNYPVELNTAGQMYVNVPWSDTNTVYSHPTHNGDDINLDTGALTGALVISDLDFNVTTDGFGHVTDANAAVSTRSLTANDISAVPTTAYRNFGTISIGATVTTTAALITDLTNKGFFNSSHSVGKCSWSYAGNGDLTDTGFGTFELAGCVIETFKDGSYKTVRITRPNTGGDGPSVLVYNDQGSSYSPGWREMVTSYGGNTNITGDITASGDVTAFSDERLKTDIETYDNALETVKSLRGVKYTKDNRASIGVIAQEVEQILPEVVHTGDDDMGTKSVAYGNMVGLLIEAIKEQQQQIDALQDLLNKK